MKRKIVLALLVGSVVLNGSGLETNPEGNTNAAPAHADSNEQENFCVEEDEKLENGSEIVAASESPAIPESPEKPCRENSSEEKAEPGQENKSEETAEPGQKNSPEEKAELDQEKAAEEETGPKQKSSPDAEKDVEENQENPSEAEKTESEPSPETTEKPGANSTAEAGEKPNIKSVSEAGEEQDIKSASEGAEGHGLESSSEAEEVQERKKASEEKAESEWQSSLSEEEKSESGSLSETQNNSEGKKDAESHHTQDEAIINNEDDSSDEKEDSIDVSKEYSSLTDAAADHREGKSVEGKNPVREDAASGKEEQKEGQKTEAQKTEEQSTEEKNSETQKTAEQKTGDQSVKEQTITDRTTEEKGGGQSTETLKGAEESTRIQKAAEESIKVQKAAEESIEIQKAAEQGAVEQKAAEQGAAEQKAAEQSAAEQKSAEQSDQEQQLRKTEKLENMLNSAELEVKGKNSSSESEKENLVIKLAGEKPARIKVRLIRETIGGTDAPVDEKTSGQILLSRDIISAGTTIKEKAAAVPGENSWEVAVLTDEDADRIFREIPDNDGCYRISVTCEDDDGNQATRDIPFKVNRFGSVYVYNQGCRLLQDAYVQNVAEDLIISEYNPDRLLSKSLKVEITRDGEPLEGVQFRIRKQLTDNGDNGNQKLRGWYRYDYIISKGNFAKDGIYQVSVSSADEAGNEPNSMDYYEKPILFRVDSTKPEMEVMQGNDSRMMTSSGSSFYYQAFDAIRLKKIRVLMDGNIYKEITDIPEVTKFRGIVRMADAKPHVLQVELTDMAGNIYQSEPCRMNGRSVLVRTVAGTAGLVSAGLAGLYVWFRRRRKGISRRKRESR